MADSSPSLENREGVWSLNLGEVKNLFILFLFGMERWRRKRKNHYRYGVFKMAELFPSLKNRKGAWPLRGGG